MIIIQDKSLIKPFVDIKIYIYIMSNNFASYYTLSPSIQQGNNYVSAQVFGPLNTSQTPGTIKYHSYGSLPGVHPNPPKFYPSDNSSSFSQSRYQYAKCDTTVKQQIIAREKVLADFKPFKFFSSSTQKQWPTETGHMNYITPIPSSMRTSILKRNSVGKSSYKQGLPVDELLSYKSYDKSYLRSRLRATRSAGCVAPKKASSIYNPSCRVGGGICNTGSIVGQGY